MSVHINYLTVGECVKTPVNKSLQQKGKIMPLKKSHNGKKCNRILEMSGKKLLHESKKMK